MVGKLMGATYTGEYTGDGQSSQDIECGFSPSRVRIFDEDGNFAEMINSSTFAYMEVQVSGVFVMKRYELVDAIVKLETGFRVQNQYLNTNGKGFFWEVV